MLKGEEVGSSSEEETVIVTYCGHPVNPQFIQANALTVGGDAHVMQVESLYLRDDVVVCLIPTKDKAY
jgi:hypothetical protein